MGTHHLVYKIKLLLKPRLIVGGTHQLFANIMVDFIALVSLFSIIQLTNSQIMGIGSATNETHEPEGIKLQWCGEGEVPQGIDTNTYGITQERRNISFRLKNGSISCPLEDTTSLYTLDLNRRFNKSSNVTFHQELSITGYFRNESIYYPPDKYCIANWTQSNVTVQICGAAPECGVSHPCVPKCCSMNRLYTVNSGTPNPCLKPFENSSPFNPILYTTISKRSSKNPVYYIRSSMIPRCRPNIAKIIHEANQLNEAYSDVHRRCFRIQEDGTLRLLVNRNWIEVAQDDYCLDGFQVKGSSLNLPDEKFMGAEQHYIAFICTNATRRVMRILINTFSDAFRWWLCIGIGINL
ncbi:unnamed protein product [Allacma fusca]|uniref:Uncharacterized protein n=1 Tax=Allacma fusca TaxID=39272 RepID=A0A8J2NWN8_9HEXA|nr:unnamed protein product [Allacma fusca]